MTRKPIVESPMLLLAASNCVTRTCFNCRLSL